MNPAPPTHLGDGAYATFEPQGFHLVLTANHHDPELSTDRVYLEAQVIQALIEYIKQHNPQLLQTYDT